VHYQFVTKIYDNTTKIEACSLFIAPQSVPPTTPPPKKKENISMLGALRASQNLPPFQMHTSLKNAKTNHHLPTFNFIHSTDVSAKLFVSAPCTFIPQ
jgi:hypothetical protein